ncbi:(deoxy)nucleoside triphosphate pyrophosphohydrolase [Desulfonatronum sp. SC1]|uniref:(deoxy)nucleoside triphosphate pyrophosphohydrolase n=1 Tax=Desulfonatronum sp. SC1 TaxID=2109626 RepID=UPI000D324E2D|nr:NUDIX domain-containing protein [Desulfonatronum sp. SC1]PTN37744.1 (deoxy)nucleoside triphosphate pyrophosphohydrolase [Desulfonatronum sp. SC1]
MEPLRVVAGIVWRGDRYLAVRRPEGKHMAGYWEFPGGKIEAGETPDQALTRELYEELGIRVAGSRPWRDIVHRYPDLHVHVFFYMVTAFHGEPHPWEGQSMAWVTPTENVLPFLPADLGVVAELAATFGSRS